jgi:S-formylglutathione hydrolase FrmB
MGGHGALTVALKNPGGEFIPRFVGSSTAPAWELSLIDPSRWL